MTLDLLDLARAVAASPHWLWRVGMSDHRGWLVIAVLPNGQIDAVYDPCSSEAREPYPDPLPDLTDPATLGCILALYEETRQVRTCPDAVYTSAAVYGLTHPRTVAALVAALLAAPAKEADNVNV